MPAEADAPPIEIVRTKARARSRLRPRADGRRKAVAPVVTTRARATRPPRRGMTWRRGVSGLWRVARRPLLRAWRRLGARHRLRVKLLAAVLVLVAPLVGLNLAVAFLGHSLVFPLSPFFLKAKVSALAAYARHQPRCLISGHDDTDALVKRAELRHHLPHGLLAAVVHVESRGYPHRISSAGAMGPGQLMPDTARQLGVDDPFDSADNIGGAARLLGDLLDRFRGNIRLAVAAYNAGPGAVRGRVPDNGQTPAYVAKVMHTYAALQPRAVRPIATAPTRQTATATAPAPTPTRHRTPNTRRVAGRGPALAVSDVKVER